VNLAVLLSVCLLCAHVAAQDREDTPRAVATRKKLKQKVSVDFKDTRLRDAIDEIKDQVKGLSVLIDNKGGVSNNQPITYKADNQPLEAVLDGMFKKNGLGYVIISQRNNAYDGALRIVKGNQRGSDKGK
jgi:hypothetical protein